MFYEATQQRLRHRVEFNGNILSVAYGNWRHIRVLGIGKALDNIVRLGCIICIGWVSIRLRQVYVMLRYQYLISVQIAFDKNRVFLEP